MPILFVLFTLFFPFHLNSTIYTENQVIRLVTAEGENGHYLVSGEMKAGVYYYIVEDGHNQYISEKKLRNNGKNWSSFNIPINLTKGSTPANGTLILHIYQRGPNKTIQNSYPVVLQRFP